MARLGRAVGCVLGVLAYRLAAIIWPEPDREVP